ncbi:MAG: ABC transporter ATP-binding protein [Phycisphaerales bacterium]|nr:ABC transporter ATP-binding protein [Phycisphaerales bacterium]
MATPPFPPSVPAPPPGPPTPPFMGAQPLKAPSGPGLVQLPTGPRDERLAIDVRNVHKTYRGRGGVRALKGVSVQVRKGEVFGLLGPNGAGKSTLVKILMTVIRPTACEGVMLGRPIGHKRTLARVGYLPEHHRFPEYLTGAQVLDFFGAMSGVTRVERKRRAPELMELVGLSGAGRKTVRQYSKGMRQRLGLAQALMNDPELLLLDEPTDGVDPEGRRAIRTILGELRARGKGILVNSHILAELELICDRAAIICAGELQAHGTINELTHFGAQYEIDAERPPGAADPPLPPYTAMGGGVEVTRDTGTTVTIATGTLSAYDFQPLLDALRRSGWTVTRVELARPTLEDAFMRVVDAARAREQTPRAGKEAAA